MPRHAYIVSIDTETGEAVAIEAPRAQINSMTFPAPTLNGVECYGAGRHADAAADALRAIMPNQDEV